MTSEAMNILKAMLKHLISENMLFHKQFLHVFTFIKHYLLIIIHFTITFVYIKTEKRSQNNF